MWAWIINQLPWYYQVGILALIVGVPTYMLACMFFGVRVATRYAIWGLLGILTLGFASKLRQDGYKARLEEEDRATKRAEKVVIDERKKSEALSDEELRKETDLWSRKP